MGISDQKQPEEDLLKEGCNSTEKWRKESSPLSLLLPLRLSQQQLLHIVQNRRLVVRLLGHSSRQVATGIFGTQRIWVLARTVLIPTRFIHGIISAVTTKREA